MTTTSGKHTRVKVKNGPNAYHVTINLGESAYNYDDASQQVDNYNDENKSPLHVDSVTQKVISKFQHALTKQDEKLIAQKYITFAEQVKKLYDSIPENSSPDALALKEQLLAIVRDLTLKSEHPGVDMLQSTLKDFKSAAASQQQQQNNEAGEGGAQTLALPAAIKAVSFAMNIADKIGTYSDSLSKASKFLEGPVAKKLRKWGFKKAASLAERYGHKMDTYATEKLKPFEDKIAKKIAPVVKSKTFQTVRRSLEVVSAAMSLKGGLKALGMVKKVNLGSLRKIRKSLKEMTKFVKNRKQIMKLIKKNPLKALKRFNKLRKRVKKVSGFLDKQNDKSDVSKMDGTVSPIPKADTPKIRSYSRTKDLPDKIETSNNESSPDKRGTQRPSNTPHVQVIITLKH
ncbi:hypothetical protein C9374_008815 [Naegleria lovaniensis]|uniref:Uncharacterized protein n=1 Tax=Naegleria lovaniensis TaxID=51637 RepID=A0AA88GIJ5_NAELO|nr:uncharacterized protein C9374_008815 [Naegleria lovaniensis]KAG2377730.1 hypothetical protein C9374_008815 [Naegleria lovaniensis]